MSGFLMTIFLGKTIFPVEKMVNSMLYVFSHNFFKVKKRKEEEYATERVLGPQSLKYLLATIWLFTETFVDTGASAWHPMAPM